MDNPQEMPSPVDLALMNDNEFTEKFGKTINYQPTEDTSIQVLSSNYLELPDDPEVPEDIPNPEIDTEIPDNTESTQTPIDDQAYYSINDPDNWFDTVTQPIEVNGIKLDMSDPTVVRNLIEKGAKYNLNKPDELKNKRILQSLTKNEIDASTLNLLIAAYNGDKKALSTVLGRNAILPTELDYYDYSTDYDSNSYDYLVSENDIKLDEIINSLSSPDSKQKIDNYLTTLDSQSQDFVQKNPDVYKALDKFMASGLHERILQAMEQSKLQNGFDISIPDLELYRSTAAVLLNQEEQQKQLADQESEYNYDSPYYNPNPKKSASLPRNRAFSVKEEKPRQLTPEEIAAMPDEDFLEYFK